MSSSEEEKADRAEGAQRESCEEGLSKEAPQPAPASRLPTQQNPPRDPQSQQNVSPRVDVNQQERSPAQVKSVYRLRSQGPPELIEIGQRGRQVRIEETEATQRIQESQPSTSGLERRNQESVERVTRFQTPVKTNQDETPSRLPALPAPEQFKNASEVGQDSNQ